MAPWVLVVDDEAPARKYLSANLRARGYAVLTAAAGGEALALLAAHPVDLLLLDLGLPDMDGLDVLTAVRARSTLPVLVLTARVREADQAAALARGATAYLTKPLDLPALLAQVRALVPPMPV